MDNSEELARENPATTITKQDSKPVRDVRDVRDMREERANNRHERELREERADTQRYMAWMSISSMLGVTGILFSPIISDSRVQALAELLGLFYIAQAGIVGAYMGVQAWINGPTKHSRYNRYRDYDGE